MQSGDTAEIVKNGPILIGHVTPLQEAAAQGNYETVEALLKAGADINAKDVRNATPLVFAVASDHANPEIIQLLIAKGAPREPAVEWARRYQDPAILPLFGLSPSQPAAQTTPAAARYAPREAIAKALAASQPAAANFLNTGGCVSCHADHLNGMAVSVACLTLCEIESFNAVCLFPRVRASGHTRFSRRSAPEAWARSTVLETPGSIAQ